MKKAPNRNKAAESFATHSQSDVLPNNRVARRKAEKARQALIKQLFPRKMGQCFECKIRLIDSNRKRMVTLQNLSGGVIASAFQLCGLCAEIFQSKQYHRLPNVHRELLVVRFQWEGADVGCVGGVV